MTSDELSSATNSKMTLKQNQWAKQKPAGVVPGFYLDVSHNFWYDSLSLAKDAQFQGKRSHFDDSTALLTKSMCSPLSLYLQGKLKSPKSG